MQTQDKTKLRTRLKGIVRGIVLGGIGLGVGYAGGKQLHGSGLLDTLVPESAGQKALFIALAFFAIWLAIALHELGHLLAGLFQDFRLALYTAGFLGIRGTEKGIKLFFNSDFNSLGGLAATFPEQLSSGPDLRRKFARIIAAGPLASLVAGVSGIAGGWLLMQLAHKPASLTESIGMILLFVTGFMSALLFLVTSLPLPTRGFMTDGARFLSLLNGGEKGLREEAGLVVMAFMGAGKLPGEYPAEMLDRLTTLPADSLLGLNGHFTAFLHHLDRGEVERAMPFAQTIEANITAVPAGPFRRYYLKDLVFFYAFLVKDAEKACAVWADIEKGAEKDRDVAGYRVKAALALLDGQIPNATAFVEAGLQKLTELPFLGQRRFEEKWLGLIREQAQGMDDRK